MQGEDFYTVEEAARALKLTPERIWQMLREGEIEGVPPQKTGASGWKIPVRLIHGRDHPPPINRSESPTTGPESTLSEPEDISGPEDIRGAEEPGPTPAQPQRDDDAAENSRQPTAPSTHRVTVQEAARILDTSVDALLLEAKDEAIADLRGRVAFLERQLESRAEEIRRRDHIIAALTERIAPAIEPPNHEKPPRAREGTVEEPTRVTPSGAGGPQEGSLRPWWRRAFGR
jgi:hypothetical protein